jgi:hypothetical protein
MPLRIKTTTVISECNICYVIIDTVFLGEQRDWMAYSVRAAASSGENTIDASVKRGSTREEKWCERWWVVAGKASRATVGSPWASAR